MQTAIELPALEQTEVRAYVVDRGHGWIQGEGAGGQDPPPPEKTQKYRVS